MSERYDPIDEILKRYVEERMRGFQPANVDELWTRFEARLRRKRGVRFPARSPWRYAAAAAAALLLAGGMSFLVFPEQVRAIGSKIVTIQTVMTTGPSGNIQISVSEPPPPDRPAPPPPPEEGPVPLAQVRDRVPFSILLPAYVPAGYTLLGHTYQETDPGEGELTTDYFGDGLYLVVRQTNCEHTGAAYSKTVEPGVRVSRSDVRGQPGTLLERDVDGWTSLSWAQGGIWYRVSGRVPPGELHRLAESLDKV